MSEAGGESVAFDPFEDGFTEWPYDQYARLRRADPVHHSELLAGWVMTRFEDVSRLLKDPTVSTQIQNATPTPQTVLELERRSNIIAGEADPLPLLDEPEHTRIRRLMAPAFRKGAVKDLAERIQRHVDDLLDRVIEKHGPSGTFDLVGDLVYPMPVAVICELMGIPDEDGAEFRHWVQMVALGLDPVLDVATRDACLAAGDEMRAYLGEQVRAKRAEPADDLTSALVHATDEHGDRLGENELIAQLQTVYIAGHEPVTAVLGNGFRGFMKQPDELAKLWADEALVENTVSELLRFDGPNQFVRRIATEDIEFAGGSIPAGGVVFAGVGAANHDPDEFGADAEVIRVDRPTAIHHLQLGAGIHACLGTHLARLEIDITLRSLIKRFRTLELDREPTWSPRMILRSVNDLHLNYELA
ncbi:MAG TPA: cytochrome P450 [Acidimicrobiales bacterium]|nr:cytochrome P450 [Acidimicrobiales bacterium]